MWIFKPNASKYFLFYFICGTTSVLQWPAVYCMTSLHVSPVPLAGGRYSNPCEPRAQAVDCSKCLLYHSFFYSLIFVMSQRGDMTDMVISGTGAPPTCSSLALYLWGATNQTKLKGRIVLKEEGLKLVLSNRAQTEGMLLCIRIILNCDSHKAAQVKLKDKIMELKTIRKKSSRWDVLVVNLLRHYKESVLTTVLVCFYVSEFSSHSIKCGCFLRCFWGWRDVFGFG